MQRFLVVGLGNIGEEYVKTRHNIGFMVVDKLADATPWQPDKQGQTCEIGHRGRKLTLLKPNTYMNLSGQAVRYHLQKLGLQPQHAIIITDDIALPFGTLRLKHKGSDGGHNGLKSISELLQTENYPRLRVGVSNQFERGRQADYVLSPFNAEEEKQLDVVLGAARDAVLHAAFHGIDAAMNRFNKNVLAAPAPKPAAPKSNPETNVPRQAL
jgi:PTH1 family peptidyl-tRNA hydrolase